MTPGASTSIDDFDDYQTVKTYNFLSGGNLKDFRGHYLSDDRIICILFKMSFYRAMH